MSVIDWGLDYIHDIISPLNYINNTVIDNHKARGEDKPSKEELEYMLTECERAKYELNEFIDIIRMELHE